MIQKPDFLKLLTSTFDDISNDNNIFKLHNAITDVVPSKFKGLVNCGLLSNLLTQITSISSSLNDNMNTFKTQVDVHKEAIVDNEYKMAQGLSTLSDININPSLESVNESIANVDTGNSVNVNSISNNNARLDRRLDEIKGPTKDATTAKPVMNPNEATNVDTGNNATINSKMNGIISNPNDRIDQIIDRVDEF